MHEVWASKRAIAREICKLISDVLSFDKFGSAAGLLLPHCRTRPGLSVPWPSHGKRFKQPAQQHYITNALFWLIESIIVVWIAVCVVDWRCALIARCATTRGVPSSTLVIRKLLLFLH
eukprot:scaffold124208_cov28-Prasinocladus_malaysianus.AAC.1